MSEPPTRDRAEGGDAVDPVGADVDESLFVDALRAAIAARGASLESLRQSLLERGSSVSVATLSYWRSGRSRPDRGGSMVALAELEHVLRVPAGLLTGKVNPRGPGSAVASGLPSHYVAAPQRLPRRDSAVPSESDLDAGLRALGLSWDDGLDRVSYHDRLEVRADRTDGAHDVRTVFVATRPDVDRFPVWYGHDEPGAFPFVVGLSNCRLGRAIEFRAQGAVAAEMLLDHPIRLGESAIVEHRMEAVGQTRPSDNFQRRLAKPIRELAMEVRFPPGNHPASAKLHQVVDGRQEVSSIEVVGDAIRLLVIDPAPGDYGLEWAW